MVIKLKSQFYSLIKNLGYNITDNGQYVENFPWLMLRLTDIFSTYAGEKEILEIVNNISNALWEFQNNNPEILYAYQKMFKILDDKSTGPVKKHGVVNYEFLLGQGLIPEEEVPDDEPN